MEELLLRFLKTWGPVPFVTGVAKWKKIKADANPS